MLKITDAEMLDMVETYLPNPVKRVGKGYRTSLRVTNRATFASY